MAEELRCPVDGTPLREHLEGAWICDQCGGEFLRGVPPEDDAEPQGTDDWYEAYIESLEDARRLRKPGAGGDRRRTGRFSGKKSVRGGRKYVEPWEAPKPFRKRRKAA